MGNLSETRKAFLQAFAFHIALAALVYRNVLFNPAGLLLAGEQVGGYLSWHYSHWSNALAGKSPFFHSALVMAPGGVPMFFISPLNEIMAVLLNLFLPPAATVNLIAILAHVCTGVATFLFLHDVSRDKIAALIGSIAYAYSSFNITQHLLGQFDQSNLMFNPLLCWAAWRYYREPTTQNALFTAFSLAGVFLQGAYAAFSFGFIMILGAFIFGLAADKKKISDRDFIRPLLTRLPLAFLIALPFYIPVLSLPKGIGGGGEFYFTYLASFVDFPYWHTSGAAQALRVLKNHPIQAETLMAYFGLIFLAGLIAAGASGFFKTKGGRFWLWILVFSSLLSLGPTLHISPSIETVISMPYALFQYLPVVGALRNSGRILMTASLAASVITAVGLAALWKTWSRPIVAAAGILLAGFYFWEFDLWNISRRAIPSKAPAVYETVKNDPDKFLLFELPQYYNPGETLFIPSQLFMHWQTFHQKPMILGCPSRYPMEGLSLTENTPVFYELTHPGALIQLHEDAQLAGRLAALTKEGPATLKSKGVKYVAYHARIPVADPRIHAYTDAWLQRMLGEPVSESDGIRLFFVR